VTLGSLTLPVENDYVDLSSLDDGQRSLAERELSRSSLVEADERDVETFEHVFADEEDE
jgi:hypothetical protein